MSVESMLAEGLYLMLIGMGFVAAFLSLLVVILNVMEKLVSHEEVALVAKKNQLSHSSVTAVISAAIHQHRQGYNK